MLRKLIRLMFQSKQVAAAPVCVPSRSQVPERNGDAMFEPRNPSPTKKDYRRAARGQNHSSGLSPITPAKFNASHERRDFPNANQLLRDGHLGFGLVGCNVDGFLIEDCARYDDAGLAQSVVDLPTQIKMVPDRDLAGGLSVALEMLSKAPEGRKGIVILTAGGSTTHSASARKSVLEATQRKTAVHVIQICNEGQGREGLADLTTCESLDYGQFRQASTGDELLDALRGALDSLTPASAMAGTNSGVIVVDLSERMVESFQGTTRIEMVIGALQDHLRQPLTRPEAKRLAWAA